MKIKNVRIYRYMYGGICGVTVTVVKKRARRYEFKP